MINKKLKKKIQKTLSEFKNLSKDKYFNEFLFCLLTPQSNALRCWNAVEDLSKIDHLKNEDLVKEILRKKTRFHKTKAKRIIMAEEMYAKVEKILSIKNRKKLRENIVKIVNGYGYKEASHFLRNIGKSDNQIAILDRHILKNLYEKGLIKDKEIKSKRDYLEKEKIFLEYAKKNKIKSEELDLLWWSKENGIIFK